MRVFVTGLAALALGAATAATAAPAPAARDFVVKHDDLDLSDAKDQKTLNKRIDRAARDYCGADRTVTGSRVRVDSSDCVNSATQAAREQMASLVDKAQRGG